MRRKDIITILLLILIAFPYKIDTLAFTENNKRIKPLRISWKKVSGAIAYKVRIKNDRGKTLLNKTVPLNHIDFTFPPGKYYMRIGAVNKFGKVGTWSDWEVIEIIRAEQFQPDIKLQKETYLFNLGMKFGVGIPYFKILPTWNDFYKNSFNGFILNLEYNLNYIDFFRSLWILRFTGFEIDTTYVQFKGKDAFNRIESDMSNILAGCNLFFTTDFNSPINLILRGGGGITYTMLKYYQYDNLGNKTGTASLESSDPFYKIGFSIEYDIFSSYFLQTGIDYYIINYFINNLKTLRAFILVGTKL